jgi:uncharacterized protein GlcG (DUF336 family)
MKGQSAAAGVAVLLMLYSITASAEDPSPTPKPDATASAELISLRDAMQLAQATLEACAKLGQPASVVVMDADGFQRVALSDDRALYIGITTAAQKAFTVLTFRTATEVLQKRASTDSQFAERYSKERGYRLSPGGLPLYRGDRFVGALAVAGAREHEGECAYAGLRGVSWVTAKPQRSNGVPRPR